MSKGRLRRHLDLLAGHVTRMRELRTMTPQSFLDDWKAPMAGARLLQISLECAADAAAMILKTKGVRCPPDYKGIFTELAGMQVIPRPLMESLSQLASTRNALVHQYHKFPDQQVYEDLQKAVQTHIEFLQVAKTFAHNE